MPVPELHEGDFVMARQVVAMYPGGAKVTHKAPKDRMLVLMAVEVASIDETQEAIATRCKGKIDTLVSGDTEYPAIGAEVASVSVIDRI